MSRGSPPCGACDAWMHAARSRLARRSIDRRSCSPISVHQRFIPDGRLAPVGLVRHACTSSSRTNLIRSDGTESRVLMSPRSAAKRIHGQVGDSCLQHDALRFGVFSFSCPRLLCVRPTEAIAGPTPPAIALTAHTDMQGAHHASRHKAARAGEMAPPAIGPR